MGYKNVANVGDRIEVTKVGSKNNMCFEPGEKGVVEESYSDGDILVNFGDGIEFFVQRESGDDYRVLSAKDGNSLAQPPNPQTPWRTLRIIRAANTRLSK